MATVTGPRTLVVLFALVAALMVAAPAAEATHQPGHPAPSDCSSGALCLYRQTYYGGGAFRFFGDNASLHSWAIANSDRSAFNNGTSGRVAQVFRSTDYRNPHYCRTRGTGYFDLGGLSNNASSNSWPWNCL